MAMFDSIINEAGGKFDLGGKAGSLLAALLALMTDKNRGGFTGFLERFNHAGLGDTVSSWINSGSNTPISNEQIESALGEDTLRNVADRTGTDYATTTSATAFMTPRLVDALTPGGEVPADSDLLSRIGGYLTGLGGATLGGIGAAAMSGGLPDKTDARISDAFEVTKGSVGSDATAVVGGDVRSVGGAPVAVGDRFGGALNSVGDAAAVDDGGGSILKWLLPLLLLGLLIVLGYMFCGRSSVPVATTNTNANSRNVAAVTNSNAGNAAVVNGNAGNVAAVTDTNTARKLTEVALPDGTKLQAYPGGIEDQLIKFIQSDEYKNGTADTLKDKWFNFDDLNFKFGTTELVPESKRQLDNITAILKAFPAAKIKIGGYTDKKGDDAVNKKLSDDRAKAVKAALDKSGVGTQVPEAEGYGEQFATVAETAGDQERAVDRKTSVRLLK